VAVIALIALYVPLAGAGPSVQRAGVMGAAALAALLAGRPASRWHALLLAAVATLALNPRVCGDVGWQLSFAAVAGILLVAPRLRAALPLPRLAAEGVAVTVAATLATAPLLAHHFGAVSLASLPANVAALPVVAPIMWLGMLQAALGQLAWAGGPAAAIGGAGAAVLGAVNGRLIDALAWLAARAAEQPWAQVEASLRSPWAVSGVYAALGIALAAFGRMGRRPSRGVGGPDRASRSRAATARDEARLLWRALSRGTRAAALAATAVALLLGARAVLGQPPAPDRLTVTFLDVGQGDATLVQHPDGSAVLFDGGPAEARVARLVRRAGVRRLSAVVATHASADHHGGLGEVLERFRVGVLLDGGDGTLDPGFRAVLAVAGRRGVQRVRASAGQVLRLGGLTVRILAPAPRPQGPAPDDPNPRGVVALVSSDGFDLFLSADAESPSLLPLDLRDVDAMKVPHHGSRDPGLPAVLERLKPEVAVIEVGEDNSYGHPAPDTMAALRAAGPAVYRTDRDGTVRAEVSGGELRVRTGQ
jgi:competence protein ComEC